jgi:predicted nucleic acid-binding protein
MRVVVDTTIWSLALRRSPERLSHREVVLVDEWDQLVREGRTVLLGVVRQEVLSGVARQRQFELLREMLGTFDDEPVTSADHEQAADCFNRCRSKGVQGSVVDLLICAVALRRGMTVFTRDADFDRYAKLLRFKLHSPR